MKIAEYIYSEVYILCPDWWLERPRSKYTPRGRKVLKPTSIHHAEFYQLKRYE
jgi:hypothetical protein